MVIQHFYNQETGTLSYVVFDENTLDAVLIDPVLDFDPASGEVMDQSAFEIMEFVRSHKLKLHFVLETHIHADHLSSSQLFKQNFPGLRVAVSSRIQIVQETFKNTFNFQDDFGILSDFDFIIQDNLTIEAGSLKILPIPTPGHTPACTSFLIGDALFTGDALFMPDSGTGRCDFPKGSAVALYESVKRLYQLPDEIRVYVGHDYQPGGRELMFLTSIGESKLSNIQLTKDTKLDEYVSFRENRDKTLKNPRLLFPSLQVNLAAGKLPLKLGNGKRYLLIPLQINTQSGSL